MPKGSSPGERRGGRKPMTPETRPEVYALRLPPFVASWLKASPDNQQLAKVMLVELASGRPTIS